MVSHSHRLPGALNSSNSCYDNNNNTNNNNNHSNGSSLEDDDGDNNNNNDFALSASLRYDEQQNESYYDDRSDADDDILKGRLKFNKNKLFGREKELQVLEDCFCQCTTTAAATTTNNNNNNTNTRSGSSSSSSSNNIHNNNEPSSSIVFVSGYSGVGKSSLIREFISRQRKESPKNRKIIAAFGKYNEHVSGDPFSAISESIRQMINSVCRKNGTGGTLDSGCDTDDDDEEEEEVVECYNSTMSAGGGGGGGESTATEEELDLDDYGDDDPKQEPRSRICKDLQRDLEGFSNQERELLLELSPSFSILFPGHHSSRLHASSHGLRGGFGDVTESTRDDDDVTEVHHATSSMNNSLNGSTGNGLGGVIDGSCRSSTSTSIRGHHHTSKNDGTGEAEEELNHLQRNDLKQLTYVFGDFLRIFCKPHRQLIWVLDDLQWADAASLELLEGVLSHPKIAPMLFCGLYRSNHHQSTTTSSQFNNSSASLSSSSKRYLQSDPNDKDEFASHMPPPAHPPSLLKSLLETRGDGAVSQLSISNLCMEDLSDFIAETLDLSKEQVAPLTEVIYSKTLGNVFFCKQALEELARKNVIYYDLMLFQWQFNVDHNTALHSVLSDDVIQMVQAKLQTLPQGLQDGLMVAAYIGHTFDLKIIHACLKSLKTRPLQRKANSDSKNTAFLSMRQLREYLDVAVTEGLLVRKKGCVDEYKFAHDRIQEAAYRLPLKHETDENREEVRGRWLVRLSQKLIGLVTVGTADKEWMLFVAVQHLNKVLPELIPDHVYLAKLNLRVANLCVTKASYLQAVDLLRAAVDNLGRSSRRRSLWREQYDFLLKLYNQQLLTEFGVGNLKEAEVAINEVLNNARFLKDKCIAQHTKVQLTVQQSDRNYELGTIESVNLLAEIGVYIPVHPTKADILKERCKLKLALGTRSITTLVELPEMQEDWIMKLLSQLALLAAESKNQPMSTFIHLRSVRLSLEQGGSKYLPLILSCYSVMLREKENYQTAYSFASIISDIYERSPQFRNDWDYTTGQFVLHSGVIHLKQVFADSIDIILANYRLALTLGNINYGFAAAMHFPLFYYAAGLPLNALLEPKLILLEDKSKQLRQPSFLTIFQCSRQFLYNLQGKLPNGDPTELKGKAMDEDIVLDQLEGNRKVMASRDLAIFRLMLAFIFDNEEKMEKMIERLEPYPFFDLALVREHLRCTFQGLAALQLGRSKKSKKYLDMGRVMIGRFRKIDRVGGDNARPILKCLQAMLRHKKSTYDSAIETCKEYRLMHFEAMMREQCGRLMYDKGRQEEGDQYLGDAMWLYTDWGALAKVKQLQTAYPSVRRYRRREASRASLTSHLKRVSMFGIDATSGPVENSEEQNERAPR